MSRRPGWWRSPSAPSPAARRRCRHNPRLADDQPAHGRARPLDRVDGRDRRERRRALRDQPRGPGRLRPAQPPARGAAAEAGKLAEEIVPIEARGGARRSLSRRRGPPADASREAGELRPVFREGGTVTAGNSSPLTNGAACLLIASERAPSSSAPSRSPASSPPTSPGSTPPTWASALPGDPNALDKAGLALDQIDLFELNEAFASQVLSYARSSASPRKPQRQRRRHRARPPVGCTGANLAGSLLHELAAAAASTAPTHVRRRRKGCGHGLRSRLASLRV